MNTHTHTHTHACMHACMHARTHAHTRTHTHTHTHKTHTKHTHTHRTPGLKRVYKLYTSEVLNFTDVIFTQFTATLNCD